jgi:hypothetical protein
LKLDHLPSIASNNNNKKNNLKKLYFTFEIQSSYFLNLPLKNVLVLKSNSIVLSDNFLIKEGKNNYTFFIFILLFALLFILFFIDQTLLIYDNSSLLLIIKNQTFDFNTNNSFKICNSFFNDLLINIIQQL